MQKDNSMNPSRNEIGIFDDEDHSETSFSAENAEHEEKSGVLIVPRIAAILLFLLAGAGLAAGMHVLLLGESEDSFEFQVRCKSRSN